MMNSATKLAHCNSRDRVIRMVRPSPAMDLFMCRVLTVALQRNEKGDKAFKADDRSHQPLGRISDVNIDRKAPSVNAPFSDTL